MRDRKKKKVFNKRYKKQFRPGKMAIVLTAVFIILPICIFLLSQKNQMTMKGDDIAKLKKKKQELVDEQQQLQLEAARLQSIQAIQQDVPKTNMVQTRQVDYVNAQTNVAFDSK